ncbi:MAG: hypothetical protein QNJ36_03880 [Calothrix sp. MO_167.B42]|nr:hypothetical protein [Calothrix sp. MO_167.B42]
MIDRFIANAVDEFLNDEENYEENFEDSSISTRDYLDMIGLEHFPDGWAPGDDDD